MAILCGLQEVNETHSLSTFGSFFFKSERTSSKRAKPNPKWRQNQKDHPDGCDTVSIWNRPFFNRSHDTLVPNWNTSHQVCGNKWFKVSNSLLFCMFRFLQISVVRWKKK